MSDPFWGAVDDCLRGTRVRVVANDGTEYRGTVDRFRYNDRHVLLRGAERGDSGEPVGSVLVTHFQLIERITEERVLHVDPTSLHAFPLHAREFDVTENVDYLRDVADAGWPMSFPVVWESPGGLEIVEGHKRTWVARQVGLDTIPVVLADVDDELQAAKRFALDHLPSPSVVESEHPRTDEVYSDTEIREVIRAAYDRYGSVRAELLPLLEYHRDRLDTGTTDRVPVVTDGGSSPLRVTCRDCDLDRIWYPDGQDRHHHDHATDHEVAYQEAADRPIRCDGGADGSPRRSDAAARWSA